jgi:hypothetical protein
VEKYFGIEIVNKKLNSPKSIPIYYNTGKNETQGHTFDSLIIDHFLSGFWASMQAQ